MEGEYTQEWAELRRLRQRKRTIEFAVAVVVIAVTLTSKYGSQGAFAKIFGGALFAGEAVLLIKLLSVSGEYIDWSCPRCGKPFHAALRAGFIRWRNSFARRCVHCGLPKWVDSDPEPKLRHELNPFRSDSIFKLGDAKNRPRSS